MSALESALYPFITVAKDVARRSSLLMNIASRLRKRRVINNIDELDRYFDDFASRYPSLDALGDDGFNELVNVYYTPPRETRFLRSIATPRQDREVRAL